MLRQNPSSSPSSAARAAATVATSTSSSMSCWRWQLMLLGLFYIVMQCDARAVNVSNTWTMPQEGLNVFYRFFRDRISWFEADAVCQFHHANLVTVDNSFQFDATRDLLRELDVNDIVWIGLMRPQSSDRFMWSSNSRPLVADTGYWAESLPLMDAPLCAVIDPIRDYRWHALRCGGPETASFLCEMPVPSWADICILKDMPNLTMQYMADTASIELIRNCQEEGLLRTMCRGKQDRERALQDLICPRERLEAQRINDITNSHFKSLQIINSIPSDNNENNDIELLPMDVNYGSHYPEELQTEKNTVQRLIEQFNVDELMQADEPANMETVSSFYKIPGLIPKPVKKSAKKVSEYPKKDSVKKQIVMQSQTKDKNRMTLEMDDMMLGDQPQGEPEMPEQILNDDVSNEIMEPLPHIKKTNIHKEAMEKMEKEAIAMKESMQKNKEMEAKKMAAEKLSRSTTTTTTTTSTTTATTAEPSTTEASSTTAAPTTTTKEPETTPRHHHEDSTTELEASAAGHSSSSTTPPATIGHPMHPQQPRSSIITEATPHPHVKESADNSHFIPPMLMVKSHYVPQANKHGHNEHSVHPPNHAEHLESTTANGDELTEATRSHTDAVMTTVKAKDFEATTLKAMDINTKHHEHEFSEKIATESAGPLITEEETTENGNMIPITQRQQEPEEEKQANANTEIMNLEEETATDSNTKDTTQTPSTPKAQDTTIAPLTTVPPPKAAEDSTAAPPSLLHKKEITLQTTTMKLAAAETQNPTDDNVSKADDAEVAPADVQTPDEAEATKAILMQELKPQTDMETETTQTAKLVEETTTTSTKTGSAISTASEAMETTKQKHDLVTETTPPAAAVATTIAQMGEDKASQLTNIEEDEQEQHHLLVQQEAEETSQKTTATATTTTELATEAMATSGTVTILATDIQTTSGEMKSASEEHKGIASEETEDKPTDNIKEAVAETTDVTTENANETHENLESNTGSSSISTSTTTTTITTIKPTTETNENTTTNSNSNTNSPTTETSTTLFMPSTTSSTSTTTHPPTAIISSTTTTTAATTTTTSTTHSTPSPSSTPTPETTRNFLKVTTEMPFKPNRRRSLTKPDTVSYMKKILG